MSRLIGDAYIVIYPQTDLFGPQTAAAVKKALAGVKPSVTVTPQLDKKALAAVESQIKGLDGQGINLDAMLSAASVAVIRGQLDALAQDVQLGAELSPSQVAKVEAQLKAISDSLELGAVLDPAALAKIYYDLKNAIQSVPVDPTLNTAALAQLNAELKAGVIATIPVGFSPAQVAAAVTALDGTLKSGIGTATIPVAFSPAQVAATTAALDAYIKTGISTAQIPVAFNAAQVAAASTVLNAYIKNGLATATIPVTYSPAQVAVMAAGLNAYLKSGIVTAQVPVSLNAMSMVASRAAYQAYLNAQPVSLSVSVAAAMAQVTALAAYAKQALSTSPVFSFAASIAQALTLQAAISSVGNTWYAMGRNALASSLIATAGVETLWASFIKMGAAGGGAFGALSAQISLFAGVLDNVLPHILTSVSVWHLAADWVIEFAAVLVPATLALGAWGAVMAFVVADAMTKLQAISVVATVTGARIGSFNATLKNGIGPLQSLQNYLNPTVWELYGDAMTVVTSKTGVFTGIIKQVNVVVEDLAARMTAAFSSSGFQDFMQNGALDAQRFGTIIGNLGGAFGDFVKVVPGYAEIIEELFEKITAGLEAFTAFAEPVLRAGLALHGFILYTGLAVTAGVALIAGIGNVAAKIFAFGAAAADMGGIVAKISVAFLNAGISLSLFVENMAMLLTNPYVIAIAALGLAVYALVTDWNSASTAVSNWARTTTQGIDALQGGAALQQISIAFGQITTQIKLAGSPQAYSQIAANWSNLSNTANAFTKDTQADMAQWKDAFTSLVTGSTSTQITGFFSHLSSAVKGLFVSGAGIPLQVEDNIKALESAYQQLSGQQQNLLTVTGQLMTGQLKGSASTFTWAQSLGLLNAAGVQAGDQLSVMQIKVEGLIQGWQTLGLTGGQVGDAVNALTFDTQLGQTGVTKLTGAYSSFISTITGGETAFTTFGTGLATLAQALSTAGAGGVTFNDSLDKLSVKGTAVGATMNGLSQSSLNVRAAFATEVTNATGLYNSLLTLATVSDAGAKGQGLLAQAGKDMVATLLPLAKGSSTAMAEVSALAQLAGGPATTSFQVLAKWVGNVKDPMTQLNAIEGKLTTSSVNLETDANNLAGAFGTTLTSAISGAVFAAEKGPQALQTLATSMAALVNGTGSATAVTSALKQVIPALTLMTGSSKNSENQFLAMAGAFHISQAQAIAMWNAADGTASALSQANGIASTFSGMLKLTNTGLLNNVSSADLGKQAFINFAEQGLHQTAAQAQSLWGDLDNRNLVVLGQQASTTKALFIQLAMNGMGLTTTQATQLWNTLRLQYLDTLATKAGTTETSFVNLAKQGLGLSTTAAQALWTELRLQYLDTLATKAGETEKAFIATANQLDVTTTAAQKLWAQFHTLASGSPYDANVNAAVSASGIVTVIESGDIASADVNGKLVFAAAGGVIRGQGASGRDSQLVMAAPGELIVPASHAPAFGDMARKAGIPGFSAGGLTGASTLESQVSQIVPMAQVDEGSFAKAAVQALVKGSSAALAAAMLPTLGAQTSAQVVAILEQALKITGTPLSWLPALETLVSKESGGNPSAVDPIDVDGENATGLFQTLPSTFAEYAMPGYASGPTNALDDAIAGIRYIKAEYGSPANITGIGKPGTYTGYSAGGMINEPVFGIGASGQRYSFAENGPEYVGPLSGGGVSNPGLPGLTQYQGQTLIQLLQQQNKQYAQLPYTFAQALTQANASGVRRAYFATSG